MPSKTKPLSPKELAKFEVSRDLGAELLQSVREMKAGKVQVAHSPGRSPLEAEALKVPPSDRSHLVERLRFRLDADAELEEEWAREADRRVAELDSEAVEAVLGKQAMAHLRARLG